MVVDEPALPRNAWLMGPVAQTFPDSNSLVRTARPQTEHTNKQTNRAFKSITRPMAGLCVIVLKDQN